MAAFFIYDLIALGIESRGKDYISYSDEIKIRDKGDDLAYPP